MVIQIKWICAVDRRTFKHVSNKSWTNRTGQNIDSHTQKDIHSCRMTCQHEDQTFGVKLNSAICRLAHTCCNKDTHCVHIFLLAEWTTVRAEPALWLRGGSLAKQTHGELTGSITSVSCGLVKPQLLLQSRGRWQHSVTCQTAASFSVPSSPLQHEVLIILLGDPQFEGVFQQNLLRFEPHVSGVTDLSTKCHMSQLSVTKPQHQTPGHLFVSEALPSHVDKKCCQPCKALWDCSFRVRGGAVQFLSTTVLWK